MRRLPAILVCDANDPQGTPQTLTRHRLVVKWLLYFRHSVSCEVPWPTGGHLHPIRHGLASLNSRAYIDLRGFVRIARKPHLLTAHRGEAEAVEPPRACFDEEAVG